MTQLAESVDAAEEVWTIDTMPTSPYLEVEDELVEIRARYPEHIYQPTQELIAPKIRVRRGFAGTTAATHADTTTLTPAYGASAGAGGGAIIVTDGTTTVAEATTLEVPRVTDETGGVARLGPISGSPASLYYSEDDPGAVGAGAIWIKPDAWTGSFAMLIRNEGDTAWVTPALVRYSGANVRGLIASTPDTGWSQMYAQNDDDTSHSDIRVDDDGEIYMEAYRNGIGGDPRLRLIAIKDGVTNMAAIGPFGFHISSPASETSVLDEPCLRSGSADPSAGAGVYAPEGSIYMRTTAAAGQVWAKTGAADTAWTQLTP